MSSTYNPVTKLDEQALSTTQERQADGSFAESEILVSLYRCDGPTGAGMTCNLVWDRWGLAKDCKVNGHKNQVWQHYDRTDRETGEVTRQSFVRKAYRRDGPRPQASGPSAPKPVVVAKTPEAVLAALKAQADVLGYRLVRKPAPKAVPDSELDDLD